MTKKADLMPPLGYPGGPCHVVDRIEDEVRSPRLRDELSEKVERGEKLSNPEARKVYDVETERGGGLFKKMDLTGHTQYRMDQRSVTVPEVRLALANFSKVFLRGKSFQNQNVRKQNLIKAQSLYRVWEMAIKRGDEIVFEDEDLGLTLVFQARRDTARIITTYWTGLPDPRPGKCYTKRAFRPDVENWGTQTFSRPPQNGERAPALPLRDNHSKDQGREIGKFEYSTPESGSNLETTVTPGSHTTPGEQYGHPYKTRGQQRRVDAEESGEDIEKTAYSSNRSQWGKTRRQKGKSKLNSRRYYRKNRQKIKRRQKKYRRVTKRKGAYKRVQKIRRNMAKRNPRRFRRRASVLTAPEIVFFTGPELEIVGRVHSVSPFTGMVTVLLNNSRAESMSVPAFLTAAMLATEEDEKAFFELVDVEIGLEAYEELDTSDVRRCAEAFGVDIRSEEFRSKCEKATGKVDLADMTSSELELVTSEFVSQIIEEGGSERDDSGPDHEDAGDPYEIDPKDDSLYYGEVELDEQTAEAQGRLASWKPIERKAGWMTVEIESLAEGQGGYPSEYNPVNPREDHSNHPPGDPEVNGPYWDQKNKPPASSRVIPPKFNSGKKTSIDGEDFVNHDWENEWEAPFEVMASGRRIRMAAKIADIMTGLSDKVVDRSTNIKPKLKRVDQKNAMWTFEVPSESGEGTYEVKLKAIRKGRTQALSKLHMQVKCACNFWRWQGPEYHAKREDYLLGTPRGTASTPDIRDVPRHHRVCKHVAAVMGMAQNYFIRPWKGRGKKGSLNDHSRIVMAKEIADRHIQARGGDDEDIARSLTGLIRYNGGLFKSERQAAFLMTRLLFDSSKARKWAKKYEKKAKTSVTKAVATQIFLEGFGYKDPSKRRYSVRYYLVDGAGVVAAAKVRPSYDSSNQHWELLTDDTEELFVRKGRAPVLFDPEAAQKAREKERRKNLRENAPLIEKIKSSPEYEYQDILQSFVDQLESGRTLSPKQMRIVRKYVKDTVDVGDVAEWEKMIEDLDQLIMKKYVKPMKRFWRKYQRHPEAIAGIQNSRANSVDTPEEAREWVKDIAAYGIKQTEGFWDSYIKNDGELTFRWSGELRSLLDFVGYDWTDLSKLRHSARVGIRNARKKKPVSNRSMTSIEELTRFRDRLKKANDFKRAIRTQFNNSPDDEWTQSLV